MIPSTPKRPYRVLHVIDSFGLGGAQIVLLNLIKFADRSRFTMEAVALHGRGVFMDAIRETGAPVWTLSFHHYFPSYAPALAAMMLTGQYDVVHCHLLAANVITKPIAAACGVRVRINHDHCNDKLTDSRPWALPADKFTNRYASHVIAVSESTRSFLVEHEGVPAERTSMIHNGVDCEACRPRPEERANARRRWDLPADAFILAGIGRLTYQKNFTLFLEVAAEILRTHPQAFFVIAGSGEEESALREKAAALGIAARVRFLGFVSEIHALYPALDLLLLSSRYEGLPITILEAMAAGVPIVAPRLDGIAEVLADGADAFLPPPGDGAALAHAVRQLINHPTQRTQFAEAALQKVRAGYSAERMTRDVEAIYLRYLETPQPLP